MFEIEKFVHECKKAVKNADCNQIIRELVTSAVNDKTSLMAAIGEPIRGSVNSL
jgi:hypothetical protein